MKLPLVLVTFFVFTSILSFGQQGIMDRVKGFGSGSQGGSSGENSAQQGKRSPDSAKVSYLLPSYFGFYPLEKVVRSLTHFQEYDPSLFLNATLGNYGLAADPMIFSFQQANGFSTGLGAFNAYRLLPDSVRFYNNNAPYTELDFVMGRAKELRLQVTHDQQIRKGLFVGAHARFSQSTGLYPQQATKSSGVNFNMRYVTSNQRYSIMGFYLNDRLRVEENGGILYDSIFMLNQESNRQTFLVRLNNAFNRQKNGSFFLQQHFNILKPYILKKDTASHADSTKSDTTLTIKKFRKFDAGRLTHTFFFSRQAGAYADNSPLDQQQAFYPVKLNSQAIILDSLSHITIENTFTYSNFEPDTTEKEFPFQYAFGIQQQYNKIYQIKYKPVGDTIITPYRYTSYELIPFGSLKGIIAHRFYFTGSGKMVLGGYDGGDLDLSGEMKQLIGKRGRIGQISAYASLGKVHPAWYLQHYTSELFNWYNNLSSLNYLRFKGKISLKGWDIAAEGLKINNFAYLDTHVKPVQFTKSMLITALTMHKDILTKKWFVGINAFLQKSNNDTIIPLPLVKVNVAVALNLELFKKALYTQFGIHVSYNTSYYADEYMPALQSFYRQYDKKYGNYPYADLFLNMRIKRARIFLLYQHANAMLGDYRYIMVPHYPQADAAFKFGINWVFFD